LRVRERDRRYIAHAKELTKYNNAHQQSKTEIHSSYLCPPEGSRVFKRKQQTIKVKPEKNSVVAFQFSRKQVN
jgi:hypothetical protein